MKKPNLLADPGRWFFPGIPGESPASWGMYGNDRDTFCQVRQQIQESLTPDSKCDSKCPQASWSSAMSSTLFSSPTHGSQLKAPILSASCSGQAEEVSSESLFRTTTQKKWPKRSANEGIFWSILARSWKIRELRVQHVCPRGSCPRRVYI